MQSIAGQTFTDYEVIITDDSPDDSVANFLRQNYTDPRIQYYKNVAPLGTPENWNEGIRQATGDWIKLMHDDDWFATENALKHFHEAVMTNNAGFYFCAYNNVYLDKSTTELVTLPNARWKRVKNFVPALYARNIIGPPSVVLVKKDIANRYDKRMKWLVDIDYYIQVLKVERAVYIKEPLVNVGIGKEQVTQYTHNKPEVEIPEGLLMQSKLSESAFRNILYYDAWWRLVRNLGIRDLESFRQYAIGLQVPKPIERMIVFQKALPKGLIKTGVFSKLFMFLSWIKKV